jgi:hypothetical protein
MQEARWREGGIRGEACKRGNKLVVGYEEGGCKRMQEPAKGCKIILPSSALHDALASARGLLVTCLGV